MGPAASAARPRPRSFADPTGVAVDAAGDLFIADHNAARVREVNAATGVITTVGGNGTPGFAGDNGPATAAELNWSSKRRGGRRRGTCSSPTATSGSARSIFPPA